MSSVTIAIPRMNKEPELTPAQIRYIDSLSRAGAQFRWIDLDDPDEAVAEALQYPGLLLPGGGDIEPALYGEARDPACGVPNLLRDAAEPKLFHAFLKADKPILGICRGVQLMNVALGGTLYQDIKPLAGVPHNDHWCKVHTVTVRHGTLLEKLLGADAPKTLLVNSQHHQAAKKIAPGLTLSALSEDGFVEALELPEASFCLGVQWHPERLSDADPRQQAIFDRFVEACSPLSHLR